ncbi:uncharacterized protein LY89DRAFT_786793 [Mollisia scopiformis]|uniref:Uncharacterized protein n=1 Tax=Mollisia scopiformis TaxID=149040 RepID=A0A194WU61_MOLSC|nr:uncharacterized protein LY89DRAFT_786793 [Mollisia scopiformis]KUJ11147.1 hypothetical protein LY89DRAFT_786793 [Mollisia scopiformis]
MQLRTGGLGGQLMGTSCSMYGKGKGKGGAKVQNLAFEVDYASNLKPLAVIKREDYFWNRLSCRYPDKMRFSKLPAVKSISFLMLDWYEVVTFCLDDVGLLEPEQWCFSLDADSDIFKAAMGSKWRNVTWKVTIAKDGNRSLCELLMNWNPDGWTWRYWQRLQHEAVFG